MAYLAENSQPLILQTIVVRHEDEIGKAIHNFPDVCLVILPSHTNTDEVVYAAPSVGTFMAGIANSLGQNSTLICVGEITDLVQVQATMPTSLRYQHWIAIKRSQPQQQDTRALPNYHFSALIHTKYQKSLAHIKTRIEYTYCPTCKKTTKDYGGKKHTYHEYGTLMSDVWRDVAYDLNGDLAPLVHRFQELFGLPSYQTLLLLDCRQMDWTVTTKGEVISQNGQKSLVTAREPAPQYRLFGNGNDHKTQQNGSSLVFYDRLINGDSLEQLKQIPDNSIDFVFTDPPYNLGKQYNGYSDDLEIQEYFQWCDAWIAQLARILKPGRTLTLLNIPLWSVRHFLFLQTVLQFQNWIAWDALSFPVRLIMPAHYTILAFSKGPSRELPGLTGTAGCTSPASAPPAFKALQPMGETYCLRAGCIQDRKLRKIDDRGPLTDLWWDIHRVKHNSRRVDHPTQLPPHLLYRLISIFTKPGELVLDCFNGSGTTTLAAHQLGRHYIGIEKSPDYFRLAQQRHQEIAEGIDPFRKEERTLTAKNSPVPRLPKRKYEIPKKELQLEVKRIAEKLGKLPTRADVIQYGAYPIHYYDEYFVSWGEVCAAARTTGMTEFRQTTDQNNDANTLDKIEQLPFILQDINTTTY
ncbi:MAG: DNA methyltransferase [Anaerolineae bacterium]